MNWGVEWCFFKRRVRRFFGLPVPPIRYKATVVLGVLPRDPQWVMPILFKSAKDEGDRSKPNPAWVNVE